MSVFETEIERTVKASGYPLTKWALGALIALCIWVFLDMRSTVRDIGEDVKKITIIVVEVRGQVQSNKENIDRLYREKKDK